MANTGTKVARLIAVLIEALIGIAIGAVLLWFVNAGLVDKVLWITFLVLGVVVMIFAIPGFIDSIRNVNQKNGVLNLILSIIPLLLGVIMIFAQQYIAWLVAIYLLIIPIINVLLSKEHIARLVAELPKMILGIIVLVLGIGGASGLIFTVAGWIIIALSAIFAVLGSIGALKS